MFSLSPGNMLLADFLPEEIVQYNQNYANKLKNPSANNSDLRQAVSRFCDTITDLSQSRETIQRIIEEAIIRKALAGKISKSKTAEQLNMSRMTLRKKMREYGIEQ